MTSHPRQQIIIICTLSNISRSKGNQEMKFCQLIEYNMGNVFLEISYIKCHGEASPRPYDIRSKLTICLDQQSEIYKVIFIVCSSWGLPKCIETKVLTTCLYHINKVL